MNGDGNNDDFDNDDFDNNVDDTGSFHYYGGVCVVILSKKDKNYL